VAPLLWAKGEGLAAAFVAAVAAPIVLLAGSIVEPWLGPRARVGVLWGFFIACAAAWAAAPGSLSPAHFDSAREAAGMLGWGLFAFAAAAPPLREQEQSPPPSAESSTLSPHRPLVRGDRIYAAGGLVLALALQLVGIHVVNAERALLVRFVTIAGGIALVGAMTDLALARYAQRLARSPRARLRSVFVPLAVLCILLLVGVGAGMLAAYQG
jgi:hypothetical protein